MIMRPPIKYALGHEGVSNTDTKEVYYTNIFTHYIDLVKRYIKRVLRGATPHHFQEISDIDGVKIQIALNDKMVSLTDKEGRKVEFSVYLIPEVLGTLLDVEKNYYRGLSNAKV